MWKKRRSRLRFQKSSSKFPIIIFIVSLLSGGFFGFLIISTVMEEREGSLEPTPAKKQSLPLRSIEAPEIGRIVTLEPEENPKTQLQQKQEKEPEKKEEQEKERVEIIDRALPPLEFYTIQVAAFKDRARAENLVNQLKEENLSPLYIRTRGKWFEVWVGKFPDRKDSEIYLLRLREKFHDAFLRRLNPPFEEISSSFKS